MGKMKELALSVSDIHHAIESGIIPNTFLPETVHVLVEVNHNASSEKVLGIYAHKDLALYDAWVCEQDPDKLEVEFVVRDMDFNRQTYAQATGDYPMPDGWDSDMMPTIGEP